MDGYIKLHRQILEWGWYEDANTFRLFMHLLLKANYYDSEFKGRIVKRGQRFTSIGNLAKEINISDKAIRISLDKLIRTNEIIVNGASNGTMITICKYDTYQSNSETEGQTKGKQQGKRRATNKEEEEIQEEKELKQTCFSFEEFWDLYDKKTGKPKSKSLFEKTSEIERELIKKYIPIYKANKPDVKYRKDPERFLSNRLWEDEVFQNPSTTQQVCKDTRGKERNLVFINGKWDYEKE